MTETPMELRELGIIFEEPLERPRANRMMTEIEPMLARLSKYPGKHARLKQWPGQSGAYNAQKKLRELSAQGKLPGKFEFTVRREHYDSAGKGTGGSMLYAKFLNK